MDSSKRKRPQQSYSPQSSRKRKNNVETGLNGTTFKESNFGHQIQNYHDPRLSTRDARGYRTSLLPDQLNPPYSLAPQTSTEKLNLSTENMYNKTIQTPLSSKQLAKGRRYSGSSRTSSRLAVVQDFDEEDSRSSQLPLVCDFFGGQPVPIRKKNEVNAENNTLQYPNTICQQESFVVFNKNPASIRDNPKNEKFPVFAKEINKPNSFVVMKDPSAIFERNCNIKDRHNSEEIPVDRLERATSVVIFDKGPSEEFIREEGYLFTNNEPPSSSNDVYESVHGAKDQIMNEEDEAEGETYGEHMEEDVGGDIEEYDDDAAGNEVSIGINKRLNGIMSQIAYEDEMEAVKEDDLLEGNLGELTFPGLFDSTAFTERQLSSSSPTDAMPSSNFLFRNPSPEPSDNEDYFTESLTEEMFYPSPRYVATPNEPPPPLPLSQEEIIPETPQHIPIRVYPNLVESPFYKDPPSPETPITTHQSALDPPASFYDSTSINKALPKTQCKTPSIPAYQVPPPRSSNHAPLYEDSGRNELDDTFHDPMIFRQASQYPSISSYANAAPRKEVKKKPSKKENQINERNIKNMSESEKELTFRRGTVFVDFSWLDGYSALRSPSTTADGVDEKMAIIYNTRGKPDFVLEEHTCHHSLGFTVVEYSKDGYRIGFFVKSETLKGLKPTSTIHLYTMRIYFVASLLPLFLTFANADLFTSITDLKKLIQMEKEFPDTIQNYIDTEQKRLAKLRDFSKAYKEGSFENSIEHMTNPISAFKTIKDMHEKFLTVSNLMKQNNGESFLGDFSNSHTKAYPDQEDVAGAATGLMRLQDTYRLDTKLLTEGVIYGEKRSARMALTDIFEIGKQAYNDEDYYHTIMWMEVAKERAEEEDHWLIEEILEYYSFALYKQGNLKHALREVDELFAINPEHPRAKGNVEWYEKELINQNVKRVDFRRSLGMYDNRRPNGYDNKERSAYEALCRGEIPVSPKETSKLYCYYKRDRPFLILAPFKVEILRFNPMAVMIRGVLNDEEIEIIQDLATPKLARATVQDSQTGKLVHASYRISKSAWLKEHEHEVVKRVNNRIDLMTNLEQSTAEELQIANYGIGGHYDPHYDFARKEETKAFEDLGTGNRVATVLFYMTQPFMGATVFTDLKTTVQPSKYDAMFWYNLLRSGEGDLRTRHAACPVLTGVKWVSNKWIHEVGQHFRRPCGLKPSDQERFIGDLGGPEPRDAPNFNFNAKF
uniref:Procollagen-proline 4-dioxygenase n=1 Tax=Rhabditophanes sp. KR3021 TaxID=114890 RepID=A0AC35TSP4_9BILA